MPPFPPEPPTDPQGPLVLCPACQNEHGEPLGDVLKQLPSGTWVRETCATCRGLQKVDEATLALHRAQGPDE